MRSMRHSLILWTENSDFSDRIHVIDPATLSMGIGLLVLSDADMVKQGMSAEDICEEIERLKAGGVVSSHCGPGTLGLLFVDGSLS